MVNILFVFQNKAIVVEQPKTFYFFVSAAFLAMRQLIHSVKWVTLKQIRRQETNKTVLFTEVDSEADDVASSKS